MLSRACIIMSIGVGSYFKVGGPRGGGGAVAPLPPPPFPTPMMYSHGSGCEGRPSLFFKEVKIYC